jgi:hypothetical protein
VLAQHLVNSPADGLGVGLVLGAIGLSMVVFNRPIGRLWHGVFGDTLTRTSGAGPTRTGRYPIAIIPGCGFIAAGVFCIVYGFAT